MHSDHTTTLAGIYASIPTPFNDSQTIDYAQLENNLAWWLNQPIRGIVVTGLEGESASLNTEEKLRLWWTCASIVRDTGKHLIAGTGTETTTDTIDLTLNAAQHGAEAALVLPPASCHPSHQHQELVAHYQAVADASSIPLLFYHMPLTTGREVSFETLSTILTHPRVQGIVDTSTSIEMMTHLLTAHPRSQLFAGSAGAWLPFLSIGAVGIVTALAALLPHHLQRLQTAFETGHLAEARNLQFALVSLNNAITGRFGVAGLKYAMDRIGLYGGPVRRPLLTLCQRERAEIDRLLAAVMPDTSA